MRISVISFTEPGAGLAKRIQEALAGQEVALYHKPQQGVTAWAGEQFAEKKALIFIGACGIAVRAIAPFVRDKLTDSPVLVLDEQGQYVIPLLSGHVGGANELANQLAKALDASAVITTATDIHRTFAADIFAKKNGLTILNKDGIAKVSAKVLRGEKLRISIAQDGSVKEGRIPEELTLVAYPPAEPVDIIISSEKKILEQAVLQLKPKEYVFGIGCRRGKEKEQIDEMMQKYLKELQITVSELAAVASIDRKKDEKGICDWAEEHRIPFLTFSAESLQKIPGNFRASAFVEQTVGVDNVCERSALAACGTGAELVLKKQAQNGITLAAAKKKWQIQWED